MGAKRLNISNIGRNVARVFGNAQARNCHPRIGLLKNRPTAQKYASASRLITEVSDFFQVHRCALFLILRHIFQAHHWGSWGVLRALLALQRVLANPAGKKQHE
jgi:hypothetical protein